MESRLTARERGVLGRGNGGIEKKKQLMEMDNSVVIAGVGRWGEAEEGKGDKW